MSDKPTVIKTLLIGSSGVGKSSLVQRYTDTGFWPEQTKTTVGVDFKLKLVRRDGRAWKLSIWDTAGQEKFRSLTGSYYRNAQVVILVYDITSQESFDDLSAWIAELDSFTGQSSHVVRILVANKSDKDSRRVISTEQGEAFANAQNPPFSFIETSARRGDAAERLFNSALDMVIARPVLYENVPRPQPVAVSQMHSQSRFSSCNC